jgi:hypothetical protein
MEGYIASANPFHASKDHAPMPSAQSAKRSMRAIASRPVPSIIWVPLIKAKPSLGPNTNGVHPSSFNASAHGNLLPSGMSTSPSPIKGNTIWESGAKSPEAPKDP